MLSAMTLTPGRRFVIVDGAERFKDSELEPLEQALATMTPDTTVAFFAREDGRLQGDRASARRGHDGGWRRPGRGGRQALGASGLGAGACHRARARPRPGRGARARRHRRRAPAAAAARAGEDRDRVGPRRARRRGGGPGARRIVLGAPGLGSRRRDGRRRRRGRHPHLPRADAARGSGSRACSSGWPAACGRPSMSPGGSRPGSRSPRSAVGCACRPRWPSGSSPTSSGPTARRCAVRSRSSPTSSSSPAAASALEDDTDAVRAILAIAGAGSAGG